MIKKYGLCAFLMVSNLYGMHNGTQTIIADIAWQDVYIVNNSIFDIEVSADVTFVSNINYLDKARTRVEKQTWHIAKKDRGIGGVNTLGKLNLLHNISVMPQVPDISKLPAWAQKPLPISIDRRIPEKVLIIYIGNTDSHWLTEQRYVVSVKAVPDGPSGYHLEIEQG